MAYIDLIGTNQFIFCYLDEVALIKKQMDQKECIFSYK